MIVTTVAVLSLTGLLGANVSVQPEWQTDYWKAQTIAAEQHKPLAVFIVKGNVKDALKLTDDAAKELKSHFVAVTINSDDIKNKKLAEAFEMTEGVVISDRTGEKQALRIEGKTSTSDLPQTLARMAKVETATTTEVQGTPVSSSLVPSYFAPASYCPSCQQGRR